MRLSGSLLEFDRRLKVSRFFRTASTRLFPSLPRTSLHAGPIRRTASSELGAKELISFLPAKAFPRWSTGSIRSISSPFGTDLYTIS